MSNYSDVTGSITMANTMAISDQMDQQQALTRTMQQANQISQKYGVVPESMNKYLKDHPVQDKFWDWLTNGKAERENKAYAAYLNDLEGKLAAQAQNAPVHQQYQQRPHPAELSNKNWSQDISCRPCQGIQR